MSGVCLFAEATDFAGEGKAVDCEAVWSSARHTLRGKDEKT